MTVVCDRADCSFHSKNNFCTKEVLFMRPQGICSEWYTKEGVPYTQQMSTWLEKEFKQYDKRNTDSIENSGDNDVRDITDNTNSSDNVNTETAVQENEKKEEEVIEQN